MPASLLTVTPLTASGISSVIDNIPQSGLILWLDATKIAGITSGTSLSAWTDSSASASHATQPSAGSQPVYLTNGQNGNAIVSWATGGKAFLASPTATLQNWTYALAGQSRATAGTQDFLSGGVGGAGQIQTTGSNYQIAFNTGLAGSAYTANAWVTLIAQVSGSSSTFAVSGTTVFGDAGPNNNAPNLLIGGILPSVATRYLNGAIGEVLIYNRILPESERASLETYLRSKWGTL